jgi:NAD(P)-dependent dehydrogenase (short-subunit alcohol dehydrogenase family)
MVIESVSRRIAAGFAVVAMFAGVSVLGAQTSTAEDSASKTGEAGTKTVLITGANRGLGLEFAKQYSEAGWNVIATARRPESATDLKGLKVRVAQLDVADPESIASLVRALNDTPIDLLINNAGIFPRVSTLAETDFAAAIETYEVNTIGPMRVTRALMPNLRAGRGKTIVSITSGLGSIQNNTSGRFYGYRESKAALNMFTRSLASELRDDGFVCVVLSPGWVQTDMGGPGANLTPEESITGMRAVIEKLTAENTGTYWNYNGEPLPW